MVQTETGEKAYSLFGWFVCLFCRTTAARAKVVNDWVIEGGVLLMGYEMYRLLSLKKSFATGRKKKTKKQAGPVIIDLDEEDRQQELLKGGRPVLERECDPVVQLAINFGSTGKQPITCF